MSKGKAAATSDDIITAADVVTLTLARYRTLSATAKQHVHTHFMAACYTLQHAPRTSDYLDERDPSNDICVSCVNHALIDDAKHGSARLREKYSHLDQELANNVYPIASHLAHYVALTDDHGNASHTWVMAMVHARWKERFIPAVDRTVMRRTDFTYNHYGRTLGVPISFVSKHAMCCVHHFPLFATPVFAVISLQGV